MQKILFLLLIFPALCLAQERDVVRVDTLPNGTLGRWRTIEIFEPLPDTLAIQREIDRNRAQIDTLRERNKRLERQKRDWVKLADRKKKKQNAPPGNQKTAEPPPAVIPEKPAKPVKSKKAKGI